MEPLAEPESRREPAPRCVPTRVRRRVGGAVRPSRVPGRSPVRDALRSSLAVARKSVAGVLRHPVDVLALLPLGLPELLVLGCGLPRHCRVPPPHTAAYQPRPDAGAGCAPRTHLLLALRRVRRRVSVRGDRARGCVPRVESSLEPASPVAGWQHLRRPRFSLSVPRVVRLGWWGDVELLLAEEARRNADHDVGDRHVDHSARDRVLRRRGGSARGTRPVCRGASQALA